MNSFLSFCRMISPSSGAQGCFLFPPFHPYLEPICLFLLPFSAFFWSPWDQPNPDWHWNLQMPRPWAQLLCTWAVLTVCLVCCTDSSAEGCWVVCGCVGQCVCLNISIAFVHSPWELCLENIQEVHYWKTRKRHLNLQKLNIPLNSTENIWNRYPRDSVKQQLLNHVPWCHCQFLSDNAKEKWMERKHRSIP